MTTTIEVPEDVLKAAMTRAKTDEPAAAVLEALKEYTRPKRQRDLVQYLGSFEGFMTPEELEAMRGKE